MTAQLKVQEILSQTRTPQLIEAVRMIDAQESTTEEERMTRAWMCDELEKRAGGISFEDELRFEHIYDSTDSYLDALLIMFPQLASMA